MLVGFGFVVARSHSCHCAGKCRQEKNIFISNPAVTLSRGAKPAVVTRRLPVTVLLLPTLIIGWVLGRYPHAFANPPQSTPTSTPSAPKKAARKPTSTSKSANVRRGNIDSIDPTIGKLLLKSAAGKAAEYELTAKTHYWKDRRSVEAGAFKPGEAVVAHLRHSRKTDTMQVIELDDKASWTWLDNMRHQTAPVTVVDVDDDTLTVTVGTDRLPFAYALNANTLWSRGGKSAQPAEFKAGDKVYVVPRALPGGDVQARAVADSTGEATQLKERASTSVHGVIKALDATTHTLTLITATHDTRVLACEAALEVLRGSKPLTWAELKAGQNVTARLRRHGGEAPIIWRITVQSARVKTSSRKRGSGVKKK